jgi:6-pyruvoyl tetrahydropterin synthase-like protein
MNNRNKIQQLQNSLYQLAKNDDQKFPNLYSKVYQPIVLEEAWERIKTCKGNDRLDPQILRKVTAYGVEKLLSELQSDLQFEAYRIRTIRQNHFDKDIIKAKNYILQMAIKLIIYPIFKVDLNTISSEFRTEDEFNKALKALCNSYHHKDCYIIKAYIQSGYDSINHEKLMKFIKHRISDQELLYLIQQMVTSGTIYGDRERITPCGIDKNSSLSPLLKSIYYKHLDMIWDKYPITWGKWLRYDEEINILCPKEENVVQALSFLQALLEDLELELDITNTQIEYYCDGKKISTLPQITQDDARPEPAQELEDIISSFPQRSEEFIPSQVVAEQAPSGFRFCGYKYRFGLHAAHSNVSNSEDNIHTHTFTITLYVHAGDNIDHNYGIEQAVQNYLEPIQGKQLSKTSLFIDRATTIEGIADTLFDPLYDLIQKLGYELVKLSISESPIRVYSVSYKRLDSTVNQISGISLDCIPIIDLEDLPEEPESNVEVEAVPPAAAEDRTPVVAATALMKEFVSSYEEEYLKDIAITAEPEDEAQIIAYDNITSKPNIMLVFLKCIIGIGCFTALAMVMMYIVKDSGRYPQGSDTFCHLYRGDLLLKNIKAGNWFPLYDSTWYNGVEIMRYWGPLPLYILAGLEWIFGTGILDTYVLFLGTLLILGGCGWLLWGIRYRRIGLSATIGLLWFFMPENMRVVILEGNLPRGVINALLPFFFYFVWQVMAEKKKNALFPLTIFSALITLCHLGITLMLIVTMIIFTLLHSSMNHTPRSSLSALGACISGVLLAGLWVVPALIGGAASGSSTNQVMKFFFESAFVSLNPFTRMNGDMLSFYFGLSVFLICILGMLLAPKNTKAGFITALILLICTTKSVYELFVKLPFSQFLWMIRFIPIGLAAAMVSFLLWKGLKKWVVLILVILLAADCATSYQNIYFPSEYRITDVQANLDQRADEALITNAKEITRQRMALMDLSEYGSFAPYYITGVGEAVNYSFGAGWEGAGTATNIVNLNASIENGWYVYLFDRALELGNDTVLVPIDNLKKKSKDIERLLESAKILGYYPITRNETSILFQKDTPKQFGVITDYKYIAIGESASGIAMIFPGFKEGSRYNINDYTYEELSNYNTIYLSGFTYNSKAEVEELLLKLAENGVNIYIDMNRIPMDEVKKTMELFGVVAQNISFSDSFPVFSYQEQTYSSLDFLMNAGDWNTVYLLGLEQIEGSCDMTNKLLPFLGTSKNKNLHFVGLNIVYYLQSTGDNEIKKLVEAIFDLKESSVPIREVVPIDIKKEHHNITITSEFDQVNTTLSYIDIFQSDRPLQIDNNLITVNSGTTVIDIRYPHIEKGLIVTAIGLILAVLTYIAMRKVKEYEHHEEAN